MGTRTTTASAGAAAPRRHMGELEEHAAACMGQMLVGVGDRPAELSHFLRGLAPADRDQFRRMLLSRSAR